jgi:hypothetical protein
LVSYLAGGKLNVSLQLTLPKQATLCDSARAQDFGKTGWVLLQQYAPDQDGKRLYLPVALDNTHNAGRHLRFVEDKRWIVYVLDIGWFGMKAVHAQEFASSEQSLLQCSPARCIELADSRPAG